MSIIILTSYRSRYIINSYKLKQTYFNRAVRFAVYDEPPHEP